MNETPDDITKTAKIMLWKIADEYEAANRSGSAFWSGDAVPNIIANAILTERERCAEIIEHRPLAIPDRQELAAYIRSGWHSIFSPVASDAAALSPAGEK